MIWCEVGLVRYHSAGGAESGFRWQVGAVGRLDPKMLGETHECQGLFRSCVLC